jgi:hypothetical protein
MSDYHNHIEVNSPPHITYIEILHSMSQWWSTTSSNFSSVGDVGTVSFNGNKTKWIFKAEKLDPPHEIVLKCIKADHIHDGLPISIKEEWLNTSLIFKVSSKGSGSIVEFTHKGLGPKLDCYSVCKQSCNHFFEKSLKVHLYFLKK